jgi:hypothetical protein
LIRCSDNKSSTFDRERFCWFKPSLESLIREFLARAIEKELPDFGRTERHDALP